MGIYVINEYKCIWQTFRKLDCFLATVFFYKQVIVDTSNRLWLDQAITKWKYQIKIKCTQNVWPSHIQQRTSINDDDLNPKLDG